MPALKLLVYLALCKEAPDNNCLYVESDRHLSNSGILAFVWWAQISFTSAALAFIGSFSWRDWGNSLSSQKCLALREQNLVRAPKMLRLWFQHRYLIYHFLIAVIRNFQVR